MKIQEHQVEDLFRQYGIPIEAKTGAKTEKKTEAIKSGAPLTSPVTISSTPEDSGVNLYILEIGIDCSNRTIRLFFGRYKEDKQIEILNWDMETGSGLDDPRLHKRFHEYWTPSQYAQGIDILYRLYRLFQEKDCIIARIDPLVITKTDFLYARRFRLLYDHNACYKHPDLMAMQHEPYSVTGIPRFTSVSNQGNIACIVNGLEAAMATIDLIASAGGDPAGFVDIGYCFEPDKIQNALEALMDRPTVHVILINLFEGSGNCSSLANEMLLSIKRTAPAKNLMIRLSGIYETEGKDILSAAGYHVETELYSAVCKAVNTVGGPYRRKGESG